MPRSPTPSAILRMRGRFFSRAFLYVAAAVASVEPSTFTPISAGVHSAFAWTFASQCALQSALICGGLISPVHFGACICTEQLPLHVPLHEALAFIEQPPVQLPLQVPSMCASHYPSHVPLHAAPFDALPSHLPSHLPE